MNLRYTILLVMVIAVSFLVIMMMIPDDDLPKQIILRVFMLGIGISLICIPFYGKHQRARWAKILFVWIGVCLAAMVATELLRDIGIVILSGIAHQRLEGLFQFLRGVVLGNCLALIISGELIGKMPTENATASQRVGEKDQHSV